MTDLNINSVNSIVGENQLQSLQNSQKPDSTSPDSTSTVKEFKRQEIAPDPSLLDTANINKSSNEVAQEELDDTIRQLNDSLQNVQRNLEFSIDDELGKIIISVKDKETDELVRQIPSEDVIELARNLQEMNLNLQKPTGERNESHSQLRTEGVFLKTSV